MFRMLAEKNAMSILVYEQVRIVVSKLGGGSLTTKRELYYNLNLTGYFLYHKWWKVCYYQV